MIVMIGLAMGCICKIILQYWIGVFLDMMEILFLARRIMRMTIIIVEIMDMDMDMDMVPMFLSGRLI